MLCHSMNLKGVMGAGYDGIYWDPPAEERHTFVNARPKRPQTPKVYEAHVGMGGVEAKVHSYRDFADNILPRIKDLGTGMPRCRKFTHH